MTAPTDYANLQLWVDASQHSAADGDPVSTASDYSGNARHLTQTLTARPTYRLNQFTGTGKPGFDFDGTNDSLVNASAMSTFVTNTAYTVFFVVIIDTVNHDNANPYNNEQVWSDNVSFIGSYYKITGPTMMGYNYDGTADTANVALTTGVATVFMQRHDSGNIILSKNGGTEVSTASGNTQALTGTLFVGQSPDGFYMDGKLGELFIYSVARSAGEVTALNTYLTQKWVTAPVTLTQSLIVQPQAVLRASLR